VTCTDNHNISFITQMWSHAHLIYIHIIERWSVCTFWFGHLQSDIKSYLGTLHVTVVNIFLSSGAVIVSLSIILD
jgi:hypothetical protein